MRSTISKLMRFAVFTASAAQAQEPICIDDFVVGQSTVQLTAPTGYSTGADGSSTNILGAQRDAVMLFDSGTGTFDLAVMEERLIVSQTGTVSGRLILEYDGDADVNHEDLAPTGLGGLDFLQDDYQAFVLHWVSNDQSMDPENPLRIEVHSDGSHSSTADVRVPASFTGFIVVPFSEFVGSATFDHVGAIRLLFPGPPAGRNYAIESICLQVSLDPPTSTATPAASSTPTGMPLVLGATGSGGHLALPLMLLAALVWTVRVASRRGAAPTGRAHLEAGAGGEG